MLSNTTDLLMLRWRAAQWMLAAAEGDSSQTDALRGAMTIEGITTGDFIDEVALLTRQFGHRPPAALRDEAARLHSKLKRLP